ncbi:MAG TPA: ribosome biogenesis GTPase Der, partial [Pirellulaceae bacterium]|nr:ribosome biogenesis GTPase Der [Pirellulaceae bacterium]
MSLPQVAIVGRPNVGKSSIFNWLAGQRLAIVDDVAGVTRDRMTNIVQHRDRYFEIVDTGGIGINDVDDLDEEIERQIEIGIHQAQVLLFVVDTREGLTLVDHAIAKRLRLIGKPLVLVANKCDGENWEVQAHDFSALGFGTPVVVSAKNHRHKTELLDAILAALPQATEPSDRDLIEPEMRIAIVGRRNVGKSTFINTLIGQPRMIVSEVAGTTRDSVNVRFEWDGKVMVAIDTPGVRRQKSIRSDMDFYSDHRAHRSIRHADVVLMFFDCTQQISLVDRKLCQEIEKELKPCIFVVNKWDLLSDQMPTERWGNYLRESFPTLSYVPIAFITGQTGRNLKRLLDHARMLFKQSQARIGTGELNRLLRQVIALHTPPSVGTRSFKAFYASQIGVQPPTIVIKCNDASALTPSYRRYLLTTLRDGLEFAEIPIRLILQDRTEDDT